MKDVVFWSGGFDSTALVLNLLESDNIEDLTIYSIRMHESPACISDWNSRRLIKKLLQEKFKEKLHIYSFKEEEIAYSRGGEGGLVQAHIIAFLTADACVPDCTIHYGYVRYDSFWHYKQDFLKSIKYMTQFKKGSTIYSDFNKLNINFKFPFEWCTKEDLLYYYLNHEDIYNNISWMGDNSDEKIANKVDLDKKLEELKKEKLECKLVEEKQKIEM